MDAQTTSRAMARPGPWVWLDWAKFLARPQLPIKRVGFGWRAVGEVGWLLLLDVLVALPLAAGLTWLARQTGLKTPEFEVLTRQGPAITLFFGALILPLFEETLFRGWLDGRRRHMVIVGVIVALVASLFAAERFAFGMALIGVLVGVTVVWIVYGWWLARRAGRTVPTWFERNFAWFYFGSALLFGLAHMSNYPLGRPWLLLPFVLPQAFAGLLFGYARVRHGMWANFALHASSNALFLGLSLSGL